MVSLSKGLTHDETLKELIYICYCYYFDREDEIRYTKTRERFEEWLAEDTYIHAGDCTKDCCPCSRCLLNQLEIQATNLLIHLKYRKVIRS